MTRPRTIIFAVVAAWAIWALLPRLVIRLGFSADMEELGQWGDAFGALNAAFSAAAVIGVIWTLRLQTKEISDQQKQIDAQNLRIERSEFDTTFFQLLGLLRELREKATYRPPRLSLEEGRLAFIAAFKQLERNLDPSQSSHVRGLGDEEALKVAYRQVHEDGEHSFGPYYRILYTILRRISEAEIIDQKQKAQYGNLVRSQLSSAEVSLIAANALTPASNNFQTYLLEFRLLKYLPAGDYRKRLEGIYSDTAFAPRD